MIWDCSTVAAIAMHRWVWDGQTSVDPQASTHEKDTVCKVMMDASMTSGFSAPHSLVLVGCVTSLQSIRAIAPQPALALKGSVNNDAPEPAASVTVSDRQ